MGAYGTWNMNLLNHFNQITPCMVKVRVLDNLGPLRANRAEMTPVFLSELVFNISYKRLPYERECASLVP